MHDVVHIISIYNLPKCCFMINKTATDDGNPLKMQTFSWTPMHISERIVYNADIATVVWVLPSFMFYAEMTSNSGIAELLCHWLCFYCSMFAGVSQLLTLLSQVVFDVTRGFDWFWYFIKLPTRVSFGSQSRCQIHLINLLLLVINSIN